MTIDKIDLFVYCFMSFVVGFVFCDFLWRKMRQEAVKVVEEAKKICKEAGL